MASHNIHDKTGVSEREARAFKDALLAHAKLPQNRVCADCPKTGPTWCSVNLGVFICMDCAGGHRNLGVHLSKVRSVTLDTMTVPQFRFLKAMDNVRANSFWEANMPADYVKTEANRAATLNNKYKFRKWIDTTIQEPTLDNFPDHAWFQDASQASAQPPAVQSSAERPVSQPQPAPSPAQVAPTRPTAAPPVAAFDLLGGFDMDPPSSTVAPAVQHTRAPSAPEPSTGIDLLGSHAPAPSSADNLAAAFDNFAGLSMSAPPPQASSSSVPFDPFAASQTFIQPQAMPTAPNSARAAIGQPQVQAAPSPVAWPASTPTPDMNWPGVPQAAPQAVPAVALQPAAAPGPKLKKSAAEIAAQVQSMYQQPAGGAYANPNMFSSHQPVQHARSVSAGVPGYPGAGPFPGQLQPQPMPQMHLPQKAFNAPSAPAPNAWATAGFQPTAPYPATMGGGTPYSNPALNGFGSSAPLSGGQPQYGAMSSANQPGKPQWP